MSKCEETDKALRILKLSSGATLQDVEKSFKKLAVKYHPDKCRGKNKLKCREKFIEINNAREFLEDYYTGRYKPFTTKKNEKKIRTYKEHIDHLKRFYDDWFGDLGF